MGAHALEPFGQTIDVNHNQRRAAKVPARRQVDYQYVTVDCPPSANQLFANVAGKGRVKTRAYREWRERAAWQIETQRPGRIVGPYSLKLIIRRASLRRDLGNFEKPLSDLIVSCGLVDDDRHCERLEICWSDSGHGVQVIIASASFGEAAA